MAVDDIRDVLGRERPGLQRPLDPKILAGIAPPDAMREIRDTVLDICDEVTLEGAEDEDLRGELLNEGDLTALADAAARFCHHRGDIAEAATISPQDFGRYGETYSALGQVERAADALQLGAHTAVLLLSAALTQKNDEVRVRIADRRAGADVTGQRVIDALFGNDAAVAQGAAAAIADRRARVRLLDEKGAQQVSDALRSAALVQAEVRGAALRDVPLPRIRTGAQIASSVPRGQRRKARKVKP